MGIWADEQARATDWRQAAECKDTDPNLFFPKRDDGPEVVHMAKAICGRCPVRADCLLYAITENEKIGIWGGKSAKERRMLSRLVRGLAPAEREARIRRAAEH